MIFGPLRFLVKVTIAMADMAVNKLRSHRYLRNSIIILGALGFAAGIAITLTPYTFGFSSSAQLYGVIAAIAVIFAVSPALIATTTLSLKDILKGSTSQMLEEQFNNLANERKVLERRLAEESATEEPSPRKEGELLGTNLELNLNELKEYYVINKSQARTSFIVGVTAVILGLATILVGVGLVYAGGGQKDHIEVATATAVAGLLGQFIGGSCFYLFNKSQDQSAHYYDRLTELQGTLLAVRLAGAITDEKVANATRQHIVFALIKSTPPVAATGRKRPRAVKTLQTQPNSIPVPNGPSPASQTENPSI